MVINILIPYCTVRLCCISAQSSDMSIIPYGTMASLHLALNMLFSTRHLVMFLMDSVCNDLEWCHSLHLWQNEAMVCVFAFLLQKKYISFWLWPINATNFFGKNLSRIALSQYNLSLSYFFFFSPEGFVMTLFCSWQQIYAWCASKTESAFGIDCEKKGIHGKKRSEASPHHGTQHTLLNKSSWRWQSWIISYVQQLLCQLGVCEWFFPAKCALSMQIAKLCWCSL